MRASIKIRRSGYDYVILSCVATVLHTSIYLSVLNGMSKTRAEFPLLSVQAGRLSGRSDIVGSLSVVAKLDTNEDADGLHNSQRLNYDTLMGEDV